MEAQNQKAWLNISDFMAQGHTNTGWIKTWLRPGKRRCLKVLVPMVSNECDMNHLKVMNRVPVISSIFLKDKTKVLVDGYAPAFLKRLIRKTRVSYLHPR